MMTAVGREDAATGVLGGLGTDDDLLRRHGDQLVAHARAPSTRRQYDARWREFAVFAAFRGVPALPADEHTLIEFVSWLALTAASKRIRTSLAAVDALHKDGGLVSAVRSHRVSAAVEGALRDAALAGDIEPTRRERTILPPRAISRYGQFAPDHGSYLVLRNVALARLGMRLCLRPSNLVGLQMRDVVFLPNGHLKVFVCGGKTDQRRVGEWKIIEPIPASPSLCPVEAVRRSLAALLPDRRRPLHALFQSTRGTPGAPLSAGAVNAIVKRIAEVAGSDPALVGGHSLRISGATVALAEGVDYPIVESFGWTEGSTSFPRYFRSIAATVKGMSERIFRSGIAAS